MTNHYMKFFLVLLISSCFSGNLMALNSSETTNFSGLEVADGCTDPLAANYDPLADTDDGTCLYDVVFNVDMNCEAGFTTPAVEGPEFGWCGGCVPMADDDGDGIYTVVAQIPLGLFEYKYAVDNFASQENLIDDMVNGASCAPITDLSTYANRQVEVVPGLVLNDTYDTCDACDPSDPNGCTDSLATNYDPLASVDDGSCLYDVTFNVDLTCYDGTDPNIDVNTPGGFTTIAIEGPTLGWCGSCVTLDDSDGDNIWSVTLNLPVGQFEYKYAHDAWAGQEQLVDDMNNGGSCAPITDFSVFANRLINIPAVLNTSDTYGSCTTCDGDILGCTDPAASNYNPSATVDDGSCDYTTGVGPIDFEPTGQGADYTWTVFENDDNPPVNIIANPDPSGVNTSATVAEFTARATGNPWAGTETMHGSDIGNFTLDSSTSVIKIMVYKTTISDVGIKLVENNGSALPEIKVANTLTNQWEELTFNFSAQEGILYDQIVIFPDFTFEPRPQDNIVYFDNITFNPQGDVILGCTDDLANNYNASATDDDGSCLYNVTFNVDMNCYDGTDPDIDINTPGSFTTLAIEGPSFGWCGSCVEMIDDGDGTWSLVVELPAGPFEYKYAHDIFAGQEQLVDDMLDGGSCAPTTDFATFANRVIDIPSILSTEDVYGSCDDCDLVDVCPSDFNDDGKTDGEDFSFFLGNFGLPCDDINNCPTDLNYDGVTDGEDFSTFLGNYGLDCPTN